MSNEIINAAESLRRQAAEKVEAIKGDPRMTEVLQVLAALNALETLLQQPKTTMSALFALEIGESAPVTGSAFLLDEFVNVTPLEAAKKYLAKVGRPARNLDDIIKGIKAGGGEVTNRSVLRNQLNRSGEVKTIGDDVFGLTEWYPKKRGRPVGSGGASGSEAQDDEETTDEGSASGFATNDPTSISDAGDDKGGDV
jgi:hypothetical protein